MQFTGSLARVRRRPFIVVSIAVVLILAALAVVRACSAGGILDSDDAEPSSHTVTPLWDTVVNGSPIGFHAASSTIVMWVKDENKGPLAPHRLSAVDARTGAPKWTNRPEGWDVNIDYINGGKISANAVVVQSNYQQDSPAIAALRLTDGKVLWEVNTPGEFARPTAVATDVVVVAWQDAMVRGLSTAEGEKLWETAIPQGCKAGEVAAENETVAVEVVCAKKRLVQSLDPDTGSVLWQQSVPIEGGATAQNLAVHGGAVMLHDSDHMLIFDGSGKVVLDETSRNLGDVRFAATADVAVASYHNRAGVETFTAVDLADGKVRWSRPLAVASVYFSGQRLYTLASLPEPLLPVGLYEIDAATGAMAVSMTSLVRASYDTLVAVDEDVVVSHYYEGRTTPRTAHLAGHQLKPAAVADGYAGGAPAADWPDSCALLDPAELAAAAGGVAYTEQPQTVTVIDAVLPRPAQCQYQPSTVAAPVVTVAVAWVGVDAEQSAQIIKRMIQDSDAVEQVTGIGDEAVAIVQYGGTQSMTEVYFRVGRHIGKVSLVGDSATARGLAKLASSRLG